MGCARASRPLNPSWAALFQIHHGMSIVRGLFVGPVGYLPQCQAMRIGEVSFIAPFRYTTGVLCLIGFFSIF